MSTEFHPLSLNNGARGADFCAPEGMDALDRCSSTVAEHSILMISPVRNEAAHIERVVRAVAAQDLRPARWIISDDRSDDDTVEILHGLAAELPFITIITASEDPDAQARDRLARAAAPRNFNTGLAAADWREFTHVMKLDGDIELPPEYLRGLMAHFDADPELGLAGGVIIEPVRGGEFRAIEVPSHHVHGALKCYSRDCFERIGGVQARLGWDTIDETYARLHDYKTRPFADLICVHHRPLGSADGTLRGCARHGECAYIAQQTLLWVTLRSFKIARRRRPPVLSGIAFVWGFVRSGLRRVERVDDADFRRFTRRELRRRMIAPLHPGYRRRLRDTAIAAQVDIAAIAEKIPM
jgi:poly-beta-1,6-N-acetyl-D-glucosamine synthase